jgi:putative ABC transport system permease protein
MVRPLDRKLLRDAWHYRGQFAAIIAVVACGVALFVALRSMNGFLRGSRDRYYAEYRFADVFAPLKRAPADVAGRATAIGGVRAAQPRVVFDVTLDVPGLSEPAVGRLVSIPVPRAPMLNELHLFRGRWPTAARPTEVLASPAFSEANGLAPGDSVGAVLNGRWEWLYIVGTAISPEYVYEIGPAAVFPDNRRFGVLWMGRDALADAFGMRGAFNDLALTVTPGTATTAVIEDLDRLLSRYGGFGAYSRREQVSHQFLEGEIEETQVTSVLLPAVFLGVTAFLLHIVLSRLVGTQRDQIATLKAFGYSNAAVGGHYLELALIPVVAGCALGSGVGLWFAGQLSGVYARFFQFPSADFVPDWGVVGAAWVIGCGAGILGALWGVVRSVSLVPAEAMRAEAPARFRRGMLERIPAFRRLSPAVHIIERNLGRRPIKTLLAIVGLALAVGIVVTTRALFDAIDYMKEIQFYEVMREDVTVTFEEPRPPAAVAALAELPGVLGIEPFRAVPVRLRAAHRTYRTAILGLPRDGRLHRIVESDRGERRPPETGLLVSSVLARILDVRPGDEVTVEVFEGTRPTRVITVAGVSDELLGSAAYMEAEALRRFVGGGPVVSGAFLAIDPRLTDSLYRRLKQLPAIGSVRVREAELRSFERTIAESFNISLYTAMAFACVIAFGMVYNGARVALSERGRELASLRVLGFSRREVTAMLLGEQAILTALAVPVGFLVAYGLCWLMAARFQSELYRIPVVVAPRTYLFGALVVLLAAALSAFLIRSRVAQLDLIAVLKTRE